MTAVDRNRILMRTIQDFQRVRLQADLELVTARLTGRSIDLLAYDEVRKKLKAESSSRRQLKDIPLDAIVGSVGRYTDFTRSFLPRHNQDQSRWANVKVHVIEPQGLQPIEVYQLGEAYFVIDGHHRVSVARELGFKSIEAYVTHVNVRVALSPDDNPDDIILKARYLEFLEKTQLDTLRPGVDLLVSVPGQYRVIEQHIELHQYVMSIERKHPASFQEALLDWYDNIYSLTVHIIREKDLLKHFPGRTETDLYLWVSGYRIFIEDELAWTVDTPQGNTNPPEASSAVQGFIAQMMDRFVHTKARDVEGLLFPGEWRREHAIDRMQGQDALPFKLFASIMAAVNGKESGDFALQAAIEFAQREGGRILGLHVVSSQEHLNTPETQQIKANFENRCREKGLVGTLALEVGPVAHTICERSRWVDLTVVSLTYPPPAKPLSKLSSGFRTLLRCSRSPVLVVPDHQPVDFKHIIVAYEASPKANEALYLSTYLSMHWNLPLTVLIVREKEAKAALAHAQAETYLQGRGVDAEYRTEAGQPGQVIAQTAAQYSGGLVVMGSYGYGPLLEVTLGSAVDDVLRLYRGPILICG